MLAWVHASLASEQEFLVSLFGDDSQQADMERQGSLASGLPAQQQQQAGQLASAGSSALPMPAVGTEGAPTIPQLLDSVFESICRPLRVSAGEMQRKWGSKEAIHSLALAAPARCPAPRPCAPARPSSRLTLL